MNNIASSKNENLYLKIQNFSKIRNKNYYNNSKMLYDSFYEQTSNKKKNFLSPINIQNEFGLSPFDIIYYFILNDISPLEKNKSIHIDYIFTNIVNLLPNQKRDLCLLILKKIVIEYFEQYSNESKKIQSEIFNHLFFLINILNKLYKKYIRTIRYIKNFIRQYININYNGLTKNHLLLFINPYINNIKMVFEGTNIIGNIFEYNLLMKNVKRKPMIFGMLFSIPRNEKEADEQIPKNMESIMKFNPNIIGLVSPSDPPGSNIRSRMWDKFSSIIKKENLIHLVMQHFHILVLEILEKFTIHNLRWII